MREKKDLILDVLTGIDEVLLQKNLEKRYTLWQKPKRRRSPLIISLISAAACILLLVTGLFAFMRTPDDVPVYHGMTISKEDEIKPSDTAQTAGISGTTALRSPFLYAPKKAVFPARMIYGGPEDKKPDKDLPVFGQNYYAMPGEDIYINIHLSNPGGYEILSFTLNGVKYSSYMFEPGSDLETLILKTNVGETGGLKEYTIDAIKYVDGERIKDVKMKGDRTVKVLVGNSDENLTLKTSMDAFTLQISTEWAPDFTGDKKLTSLAIYREDKLYKELSPDTATVEDLPLGNRFVLKATYLDGKKEQAVYQVFDTPSESQGLTIQNGVITGIGSCTDTVLHLDHPVGDEFLKNVNLKITEIYMTENVKSIGKSAFASCKSLEKVVLPSNLKIISEGMFSGCSSLESITVPEGVTTINYSAFSGCIGFESFTLPEGVTTIEDFAFAGCRFKEFTISNTVTSIGFWAISCEHLESIIIPESVKTIKDFAFATNANRSLVIRCEAPRKPEGFEPYWNAASDLFLYQVKWGYVDSATCDHVWDEATCKKPKTCTVCGLTEGSTTDDHVWDEATCGKPKTCTVCGLTEGSATDDHVWDEATCGKPRTCTVCGLKKSTPHVLNEDSVCTLCGRSAADIRQEVIKNAPKTSISLYNPIVEIWENHLHLLITAPYEGEVTGNGKPPKDLTFDLYYAPKGSNDYALTSLQPWSLYSSGDTAIYRLQFYDLLYPHLKVGTEYDVTIVMTQDDEIVGWSNVTLLWSQTMDNTVKQALQEGILSCNHVWEEATCGKPKTCTVCGLTEGSATGNHVWENATCEKPKTCTVCGLTEGSATGNHVWENATCEKPKTCTVCGLTEGSATGNHVWENATCQKPKHCSVCGLEEGLKKPHVLNEKSVCTLCGHSYNAKDVRQEILEITPQENVYFGTPVVEIWEGHLQMLIIAPYSGEVTGNGDPPKDLTFDLYYAPCGSNDYLLTSLQPWSLYSFGNTAIYRLQFYDLLYPHLTVGTEYDVTIVIRRGNEIVGWNCVALLWSKTLDDTVKQAVREDILSCDHIWQDATCKKPMTCSVCGLEKGAKNPHVLNEESVCTLCGHKYSVADSRQDVISTAPKINMYFFYSAVEIWSNHLQLLIMAPYEGETAGSYDPLEGLTFDLYHAPQGSNDYTLTSLQPWSLSPFASSAVYRIHFYDLLYPHFTVGTKYDVTVVMKQDDEVVGYAELSLSWTQKLEDLVVMAINDPGITK